MLVRAGHTEAGCDLAALAGLEPASVICEIMNDDGTMARLPELLVFAEQHNLKVGAISDLIHYRSRHECLIEQVGKRQVVTPFGQFTLHAFRDNTTSETHLALSKGDIRPDADTLVRVHEPLSVMDWLDAGHSPHSWSMSQALSRIEAEGKGVVVLLHRTEHGSELLERALPDLNAAQPRAKWDAKTFGIGAQMLKALGVGRMTLLSQPRKIPSMTGFGLEVSGYLLPDPLNT